MVKPELTAAAIATMIATKANHYTDRPEAIYLQ